MIHAEDQKIVVVKQTETLNNGSLTSPTEIDTLGYGHCRVLFITGTLASSAAVAFKVQESDDSGSNQADITGASGAFTDSDDDAVSCIDIDCRDKKRYLTCSATESGSANAPITVIAILSRGGVVPPADTGFDTHVQV